MRLAFAAFTDRGLALAQGLAGTLGGTVSRCGPGLSLADWTAAQFAGAEGLVYVGAAGIAVRAIAPHLQGKAVDPAVVVVDEQGRWAIPILSGHLGGANALARRVAAACGGTAVLTTATDGRGLFAVDAWAKAQGCAVLDPGRIKTASARLLAGQPLRLCSGYAIPGTPPPGVQLVSAPPCEVLVSVERQQSPALRLAPRIGVLGVGCRRGTPPQVLEQALQALLEQAGVWQECIRAVATIDRKQDEPGLLDFCRAHGWPLQVYSAQALQQVPGSFSGSGFVRQVTGVDNVCERSAVLASGGALVQKKLAGNGVTMALALAPFRPDWRWQDA